MSANRQLVFELRHRRASGGNVRLLGDSIVPDSNLANSRPQITISVPNISALNLVSTPLLPLRVNLPPLLNSASLRQHLSITAPPFTLNTDNVNKI